MTFRAVLIRTLCTLTTGPLTFALAVARAARKPPPAPNNRCMVAFAGRFPAVRVAQRSWQYSVARKRWRDGFVEGSRLDQMEEGRDRRVDDESRISAVGAAVAMLMQMVEVKNRCYTAT